MIKEQLQMMMEFPGKSIQESSTRSEDGLQNMNKNRPIYCIQEKINQS